MDESKNFKTIKFMLNRKLSIIREPFSISESFIQESILIQKPNG
jgi:hypothetical protein